MCVKLTMPTKKKTYHPYRFLMLFGWCAYLLFSCGESTAQTYNKALYELRDQTTAFMLSIAEDIHQFDKHDSNLSEDILAERMDSLTKLPVFQKVSKYLEANKERYTEVREQAFRQLSSPPANIKERVINPLLTEDDFFQLLGNHPIGRFINVQSYTPQQIGLLVNNMVSPFIFHHYSMEEMKKPLVVSYAFGVNVYGEEITDGKWRIWYANRVYGIAFIFDINSSVISDLYYSIPGDVAYGRMEVPTPPVSNNRRDSLKNEINKIRWDAYDEGYNDSLSFYRIGETPEEKVREFYHAHRKRFKALRIELLARFAHYPEGITGAWVLADDGGDDYIRQSVDEMTSGVSPYAVDVEEISSSLAALLPSVLSGGEKPDYSRIGLNAIIGHKHYVTPIANQAIWKIRAEDHDSALEYLWNIDDGTVSELKYYTRNTL